MVKFSLIIIHLFYGFFQALYILYINDKPKKRYIKNWSKRLLSILKIPLQKSWLKMYPLIASPFPSKGNFFLLLMQKIAFGISLFKDWPGP